MSYVLINIPLVIGLAVIPPTVKLIIFYKIIVYNLTYILNIELSNKFYV